MVVALSRVRLHSAFSRSSSLYRHGGVFSSAAPKILTTATNQQYLVVQSRPFWSFLNKFLKPNVATESVSNGAAVQSEARSDRDEKIEEEAAVKIMSNADEGGGSKDEGSSSSQPVHLEKEEEMSGNVKYSDDGTSAFIGTTTTASEQSSGRKRVHLEREINKKFKSTEGMPIKTVTRGKNNVSGPTSGGRAKRGARFVQASGTEGLGGGGALAGKSPHWTQEAAPKPPDVIVLPLLRRPIFPGQQASLHVKCPKTIAQLKTLSSSHVPYVGMFLTKYGPVVSDQDSNWWEVAVAPVEGEHEGVDLADASTWLHKVGCLAKVKHIVHSAGSNQNASSMQVIVQAHRRLNLQETIRSGPPLQCAVEHWPSEKVKMTDRMRVLIQELMGFVRDLVSSNPLFREQMHRIAPQFERALSSSQHRIADFAAALTSQAGQELQAVLEEKDIENRLQAALLLLRKELERIKSAQHIEQKVQEKLQEQQREFFLKEQLGQIRKDLGVEKDDKEEILKRLKDVMAKKEIPEDILATINQELEKFQELSKHSSEYGVTRTYLEWLIHFPWGVTTKENLDIAVAQQQLDQDHYGLKDIKDRILEFIAVGTLRGHMATPKGKILCFVGPPGVGKTSIGKSIAASLHREFYRFSVGGLTDVAEIKGHRRTYVGAMPGKIVQILKKTQSLNSMVLIDEIDKLGHGYQGDPASALLELLDPSQNDTFMDHYLDVPIDLSQVLFVCTANVLDTIPGPLLDRMEVIRLAGYDHPEKVAIADQYLMPKAFRDAGLPEETKITSDAMDKLIKWYCREAGVRNLQQKIEKIARKLALQLVEAQADGKESDLVVTEERLNDFVGKPLFQSDELFGETGPPVGVARGLAWTAMGGTTLFVESVALAKNKGAGSITSTGQLGKVMQESLHIAVTNATRVLNRMHPGTDDSANVAVDKSAENIADKNEASDKSKTESKEGQLVKFFDTHDIHVHVPEGATPKDGPSAGVTLVTALLSLAMKQQVNPNLAMTGEISLNEKVLPVGGIKEKVIAARRSGVKQLVLPKGNLKDYDELPDYLKDGLDVTFCNSYDDVFKLAFPSVSCPAGAVFA